MLFRCTLALLAIFSTATAWGTPVRIIVSGGFGTCNTGTPEKMADYLMDYAREAQRAGDDVKFIVTCFSKLRPSEDLEYYSFTPAGRPSEKGTVRGGNNFSAAFNQQFLQDYLGKEIPANARVIVAGQSHGGWVALKVAASRPVDFVATFDPIDRIECNFRNILSAGGFKRLKNGQCTHPGQDLLLAKASKSVVENDAVAINLTESASFLHSRAIDYRGFKNVDFGRIKPQYFAAEGQQAMNAKMHKALAVDPDAWRMVLKQLKAHSAVAARDERSLANRADDDIQITKSATHF